MGLYLHIPNAPTLEALGGLFVSTGCDHEIVAEFFDRLVFFSVDILSFVFGYTTIDEFLWLTVWAFCLY